MTSSQSVTICDGYRIFRDNHGISRNSDGFGGDFPLFCPDSVTAEKKREEKEKRMTDRTRKPQRRAGGGRCDIAEKARVHGLAWQRAGRG